MASNQLDMFSELANSEREQKEAASTPDAHGPANSGVHIPNISPEEKHYLHHAEWCYQFFDNEPVVFAYYNEPSSENSKLPLQIVLEPVSGAPLTFTHKGMSFKLFAREITEATLAEMRGGNNAG